MTNNNSKRSSLLKLLLLIPIVGIALAVNAETVTDYVYDEPQKQVPVKKGRKNATIKTGSGKDIQIIEDDRGRGGAEVREYESKEEMGDAAYDVELFTVKGKVFDADDKSPIVGAVVKVAGSTKGTVTDREGNFRLELSVGNRIEVLYAGYDAYSVGVSKAYAKDYDYMIALNKEGTDTGKAFDVVENMPKFPGGPQALFEYLANNVRYPKEAEAAGLQGRVIATFVVEKDGSVTNANIVKSVDPALDAEALRVVAGMPNWEPGTQDGKAVRVKYTVPITFRLQGEDGKEETGK